MRCFVALWPDDAARERLAAVAREQQRRFPRARAMRAENLHLTLAFIGELDETALAQRVRALLDELRVRYDRKPFVAHVTLLRDLTRDDARRAAAPIAPPVVWRADRPQLLQSAQREGRLRYERFVPAVTEDADFGADQTLANRPLTKRDA
ncbi:MAG: hypothetical protein L6Q72_08010 [Burkholderiaceae bacterium]|nr:hypothetical protein [Burkholderiaceae bacterium]